MSPAAPPSAPTVQAGHGSRWPRVLGALAVLVVGAVHAQEYVHDYYRVIPIIGPMFLVNVISAAIIGMLLLAPISRAADRFHAGGGRLLDRLLASSGIGLAGLSLTFLFISERTRLFGFKETGYRPAMYVAALAEALAVVLLGIHLTSHREQPAAPDSRTLGEPHGA